MIQWQPMLKFILRHDIGCSAKKLWLNCTYPPPTDWWTLSAGNSRGNNKYQKCNVFNTWNLTDEMYIKFSIWNRRKLRGKRPHWLPSAFSSYQDFISLETKTQWLFLTIIVPPNPLFLLNCLVLSLNEKL